MLVVAERYALLPEDWEGRDEDDEDGILAVSSPVHHS